MHVAIAIFQLWLAPLHPDASQVGVKTTIGINNAVWLKVRIQEPMQNLSQFQISDNQPTLRYWGEFDF
jgi:hypothetical protein